MNKKAVTPLISSLLLIFFAIILGVLVMSWGNTGYEQKEIEKSCKQASLNILSVYGEDQVCYKEGKIYFTLENNGEIELKGAVISIIGSNEIERNEISFPIAVAGIEKLETSYDSDIGYIMQLRFSPMIGKERICASKIFKLENIPECQNV